MPETEGGQVNVRMNLVGAEEATASIEGLTLALEECTSAANQMAAALGRLGDVLISLQPDVFDVSIDTPPNWPGFSEDDRLAAEDELARRNSKGDDDA